MKQLARFKISIIFLTILFLTSCQSIDKKAEEATKNFLKTEILNFDSYEPVITKLDTLHLTFTAYDKAISSMSNFFNQFKDYDERMLKAQLFNSIKNIDNGLIDNIKFPTPEELKKELYSSFLNQVQYLKELSSKMNHEQKSGWIIYQKFKCLDEDGNPAFMEYYFLCDNNFKNCHGYPKEIFLTSSALIISIKELTKEHPEEWDIFEKELIDSVIGKNDFRHKNLHL